MMRLLLFLAIGFVTGGVLFVSVTGDVDELGWYLGLGIPVIGILGSLLPIAAMMRKLPQSSRLDIPAALADGRGALARVTSFRRTGTSINDVPLCEVTLVVQPRERAAYSTTYRELMNSELRARRQPGQVVVVARHALDRPELVIADQPDASWAATLEESHGSVPDAAPVWKAPDTPLPGQRKPIIGRGERGRPARMVAYVALAAIGAGITLVPNWSQFRTEAAAVFTEHGDDFTRNDRQREAVEAIIAVMGHSTVTHVGFYDGYVLVTGLSAPGAVTLDDYQFRYGEATREGPTLIQSDDLSGDTFDLRSVDVSRIPEYVAAAITATGIEPAETPYVGIDRFSGPPAIDVTVRDEYFDGTYRVDISGKLVYMDGGRPGSASDKWEKEHK
ncbi:hypothetical protein Afil01_54300 [Actinorhabdospora filicis]|uniref:Uncharacterized protein n=1 Tax=Actinorhabdospora filicis TaxID=1785913 RepID=A0A9W6SR89_9ACTN|nr:hypothetical protein [Actinorhabdospora filicis]GLZ80623.1 hypothetical protein Afil01_54300 [Actinorhabdospora filicis]